MTASIIPLTQFTDRSASFTTPLFIPALTAHFKMPSLVNTIHAAPSRIVRYRCLSVGSSLLHTVFPRLVINTISTLPTCHFRRIAYSISLFVTSSLITHLH